MGLGYQRRGQTPSLLIASINVHCSMGRWLENFNRAEVDILTDLLILQSARMTSLISDNVSPLDGAKTSENALVRRINHMMS